jgi:hypothetical protein
MSTAGQAELGRLISSHYFWFRYLSIPLPGTPLATSFLMCLRGQRRPALSGIRRRPFDFSSGGASTANLEVTGRRVYNRRHLECLSSTASTSTSDGDDQRPDQPRTNTLTWRPS